MGPQLVTSLRPFPSRRLSKFPSVPHFFKSPSHSGPNQSRTSRPLFLSRDAEVQMRRTHQSKASQQRRRELTTRGRRGVIPIRPNFSPLFRTTVFGEDRARPFQNGQRDRVRPGRRRQCSVVLCRLGATATKCLFTSQKLHLHLFRRGTRGDRPRSRGRETHAPGNHPPAMQVRLQRCRGH